MTQTLTLSVISSGDMPPWNQDRNDEWFALNRGDHEVYKKMLSAGRTFVWTDACGRSALHVAAMGGNLEIVKDLLSRGHNINAQDNSGDTPILTAVSYGHLNIVEFLEQSGADLDIQPPLLNNFHARMKAYEYK